MQQHAGAIDTQRSALDQALGDREHGTNCIDDLVVQRPPRRAAVLVANEPRAQPRPALEQFGLTAGPLVIDRGPAGQGDELFRGDDPLDKAVGATKLDLL